VLRIVDGYDECPARQPRRGHLPLDVAVRRRGHEKPRSRRVRGFERALGPFDRPFLRELPKARRRPWRDDAHPGARLDQRRHLAFGYLAGSHHEDGAIAELKEDGVEALFDRVGHCSESTSTS